MQYLIAHRVTVLQTLSFLLILGTLFMLGSIRFAYLLVSANPLR